MNPMKVGLLGLGVVGGGTWTVLSRNAEEIARRAGRRIEVTRAAVRDVAKARSRVGDTLPVDTDVHALVRDPAIDIVVELIGGDTLARELVLEAIANGKHVVTANKALLAKHGNEIFAAAHERGVMVAFEAAVAGGIPIIKAIREGLTANRIQWVAGIINGTTNFILSEMRTRGLPFADVLAEAQRLGYAEADPTFDVEGVDAAHKLTLLARWPSACRCSSIAPTSKASRSWPPRTSSWPSAWATASSCWASPSAAPRASSCACIPRWCRPSACWPMSRAR